MFKFLSVLPHNNTSDIGLTFLWSGGFALLSFSVIFFIRSFTAAHLHARNLAWRHMFACLIGAGAYWLMYNGNGITRKESGRAFYHARFIEYAITAPLMLYETAWLSRASSLLVLTMFAVTEGCIFSALQAGLNEDKTTIWRWFTVSCFLACLLAYLFIAECRANFEPHARGLHTFLSVAIVVIGILAGLGFGLSDGGYIVEVNYTHLWFIIVDFVSKCILPSICLITLAFGNSSQKVE